MLRSNDFDVLTFDCYGTLIDWETGILAALKPILRAHSVTISDAEVLELYGEFEAQSESGPYRNYREVLASVVKQFGERYGFVPRAEEVQALGNGLPCWQPWPDTVDALEKLARRFKLAIISNVDDDLFSETRRLLPVDFAHVFTAQQAQCYKPGLKIFQHAIAGIGSSPDRILHVGQSLYHDVQPAQGLGLSTAWVNRPSARKNVGAVKKADAVPDLKISDLRTLSKMLLG